MRGKHFPMTRGKEVASSEAESVWGTRGKRCALFLSFAIFSFSFYLLYFLFHEKTGTTTQQLQKNSKTTFSIDKKTTFTQPRKKRAQHPRAPFFYTSRVHHPRTTNSFLGQNTRDERHRPRTLFENLRSSIRPSVYPSVRPSPHPCMRIALTYLTEKIPHITKRNGVRFSQSNRQIRTVSLQGFRTGK
jgi:hypothetical protein